MWAPTLVLVQSTDVCSSNETRERHVCGLGLYSNQDLIVLVIPLFVCQVCLHSPPVLGYTDTRIQKRFAHRCEQSEIFMEL